jgi:DNA replication protein DnaC
MSIPESTGFPERLDYLKLPHVAENYEALAKQAAQKHWTHVEYLERLLEGEYQARQHRAVERRIQAARFGAIKTLDSFEWDWPKKINEAQIRNIFRLGFVSQKSNVIFMGRCGTGKSHLAAALGYHACQHGHSVLFTSADRRS